MASELVSARLRHLNDSAHLLASSAPKTSAFLMAKCHSIMFDSNLARTESQTRQSCGACGSILLLGTTASRSMRGNAVKRRRWKPNSRVNAQDDPEAQNVVLYHCNLCGTDNQETFNVPLQKVSRNHLYRASGNRTITSIESPKPSSHYGTLPRSMSLNSPNPTSSANANSKRRAKGRKQGGLQALLAKKKEIESGTSGSKFGLDLLDLMKKS